MNNKYELIYEGKAKKVFTHHDVDKVKIEFKDDATAFNALKKAKFEGKGKLNCLISAKIFELLLKKLFRIPLTFKVKSIIKSKSLELKMSINSILSLVINGSLSSSFLR